MIMNNIYIYKEKIPDVFFTEVNIKLEHIKALVGLNRDQRPKTNINITDYEIIADSLLKYKMIKYNLELLFLTIHNNLDIKKISNYNIIISFYYIVIETIFRNNNLNINIINPYNFHDHIIKIFLLFLDKKYYITNVRAICYNYEIIEKTIYNLIYFCIITALRGFVISNIFDIEFINYIIINYISKNAIISSISVLIINLFDDPLINDYNFDNMNILFYLFFLYGVLSSDYYEIEYYSFDNGFYKLYLIKDTICKNIIMQLETKNKNTLNKKLINKNKNVIYSLNLYNQFNKIRGLWIKTIIRIIINK